MSGMLVALNVILTFFDISLSNVLRISFSFLPLAMGGMLYGPVVGGAMGVVGDILGYLARPDGPFFPGFTLNALLSGALYGLFLYKRPVKLKSVIAVSLLITVSINLLLNPVWLSMMYGNAFIVLLTGRIVKNVIMFPINTALLFAALKLVERVKIRSNS
ncbi:folate transporter [Clostridium thermosuccinogenes]|uniref:Folate transporter n=2 Tax=Clostridium thermosuccinogenes TaxID=84032 RepID=A0A2K2FBW9_9CLOT|nr:folate transporter [Pseudoclostridium thermosuccinogenes]PNT96282.1 folate transporter [Pseudoclostridium thermosuccinogenes]PNT97965.1 folate transporter [Pseudoclostridium thermosuccinogenes]